MLAVVANGIKVYVEEYGTGGPILGIHGTPSSAVLWRGAGAGSSRSVPDL